MDELNSFVKDESLYYGVDEPNGFVVKLLVKGEQGILENSHGKEARARDSLVQLLRVSSSGEQGSLHHSQRGAGSESRVCPRHNLFGRGPGHNIFGRELPGEGGARARDSLGRHNSEFSSSGEQGSLQDSRGEGDRARDSRAAASTTPGSIPANRGT